MKTKIIQLTLMALVILFVVVSFKSPKVESDAKYTITF